MSDTFLKAAIGKALAYSDLFDYPLSKAELWLRLPAASFEPSQKDFSRVLSRLVRTKWIGRQQNWYFLPGRERICETRKRRETISQAKWRRLKPVAQRIGRLGWVRLVAVTGALAVNNADRADDIDLLIVTDPKRLWLTRLVVVGLTELWGVRRRPGQTAVADTVCLNMFLETTTLKVPTVKQNLYSAYEVIQVKPVVNKQKTYERLLAANAEWVRRFLPNSFASKVAAQPPLPPASRLGDWVDALCFWLQRQYMSHHRTREVVTRDMAFFHPQDTGRHILAAFHQNWHRFLTRKRV